MIETPLVTLEHLSSARGGAGETWFALACEALKASSLAPAELGGVIVATFSNPDRFPALSVRLAAHLGLPSATPAFDLQMACSAYPYAVYLAGKLAADTKRKVLVVNGDVQSALVDRADHATGAIFSDAVTASVVGIDPARTSYFDFLSRFDDGALTCSATGPIAMDGMRVFAFVATEVREFLQNFRDSALSRAGVDASAVSFVPHQANPYMIRQLAKSLDLTDRLVTLDPAFLNPGSCSVPLTLATNRVEGLALIAGFGAGYSASVGLVEVRGHHAMG